MTKPLTNTRLWITGASSGIGFALAQAALAAGAQVAAGGRRSEALEKLRPQDDSNFMPLVFDVCNEESTLQAAEKIRAAWGGIDWVVANAGDCLYIDPQKEWDNSVMQQMMQVNYFGFIHTAQAAMPLLENARGRGLLAATVSAAVLAPLPRGCAYGASKAAVCYFLQSLRGHYPQVDFSLIYPGFVKTPLTDKNDFPMPTLLSSEKAAAIILRGLSKRQAMIRFPRRLMAALHIINMLPARLQQKLLAHIARHD